VRKSENKVSYELKKKREQSFGPWEIRGGSQPKIEKRPRMERK